MNYAQLTELVSFQPSVLLYAGDALRNPIWQQAVSPLQRDWDAYMCWKRAGIAWSLQWVSEEVFQHPRSAFWFAAGQRLRQANGGIVRVWPLNSGCLASVRRACARFPRGWWCDFDTTRDTSKDNPRILSLIWKAIHMGTKRRAALCSISQSPKAADPQPRRESVRSH